MQLIVREFSMEDIDAVADIHLSVADGWSKAALRQSFDNALTKSFVVEKDGQVVSFCSFLVSDDAELVFICTHKDNKRQGFAQILLDEAIAKISVPKIVLEVRQSNIQAQKLYEKFGFEQIGIRKNFYEKPNDDAIIYSLELI